MNSQLLAVRSALPHWPCQGSDPQQVSQLGQQTKTGSKVRPWLHNYRSAVRSAPVISITSHFLQGLLHVERSVAKMTLRALRSATSRFNTAAPKSLRTMLSSPFYCDFAYASTSPREFSIGFVLGVYGARNPPSQQHPHIFAKSSLSNEMNYKRGLRLQRLKQPPLLIVRLLDYSAACQPHSA
jgi:hypothetical protein